MRIGLLGGSFDPVHSAHIEIARRARLQHPLDEVWLLPAGQPPHKDARSLSPAEHRLAMLSLAVTGEEGVAICTFELEQGGVCYSVDTVGALSAVHREHQFFFIMGEDSFDALGRWRRPDVLVQMAPPIVAPRPVVTSTGPGAGRKGLGRVAEVFGVPVHWLSGEPRELSSSGIRDQLRRGEEAVGTIHSVQNYAREHGLYSGSGRP